LQPPGCQVKALPLSYPTGSDSKGVEVCGHFVIKHFSNIACPIDFEFLQYFNIICRCTYYRDRRIKAFTINLLWIFRGWRYHFPQSYCRSFEGGGRKIIPNSTNSSWIFRVVEVGRSYQFSSKLSIFRSPILLLKVIMSL
jgi:hypothetical protein